MFERTEKHIEDRVVYMNIAVRGLLRSRTGLPVVLLGWICLVSPVAGQVLQMAQPETVGVSSERLKRHRTS